MNDVRSPDSLEPSEPRNGVKDSNSLSQIQQRRIEHATTVAIDNERYTTIYTLEIRPPRNDTVIATNTIHRRIFDAIKEIDESAAIISLDQIRITHGKDMSTEKD